jgi:hypothetical protein
MLRPSFRLLLVLVGLGIVAEFFLAAPSSLFAESKAHAQRPAPLYLDLADTGKTVELPVGHQLVVTLPLRNLRDNTWYVSEKSDGAVKLIAGPDERRPKNWTEGRPILQVFYFQRESPGTVHLVMQQKYWSKPMILQIVD